MRWFKVRRPLPKGFFRNCAILLSVLGPGFITANVDNDAGGIATYSMAGAAPWGYACLWTILPVLCILILAQEMGARMGAVTGKGLADLIREQFGVKLTFYLMAALLIANIGNTVAEFAGIAAGMELLGSGHFFASKYVSVPLCASFVWILVVKGSYKGVEKVFIVASLFYVTYLVSGYLAQPAWLDVGRAIVRPPVQFTANYLYMLVGIIGASVAPWMQFYLQSAIVEKEVTAESYPLARLDVIIGCVMSCTVAFFIIVACGSTIGKHGIQIDSAAEAAIALKPLAGEYCAVLFAFGLFIASLFAASILPLSTAFTICEGLGWETGVNKTFKEAPQFYGLYTAIIICGAASVLWPRLPYFQVMLFSQVLNGLLLPAILFGMLWLINRRELMGEFTNSRRLNIFGGAACVTLLLLNGTLVVLWLLERN
ncbi:MAG: divalent metal cation transporter [Deltaproteobacteria bacterium]|nr:divalent metal cation transporter [Deltaproteobacteria bacterium]